MPSARHHAPATARNREPIFFVLNPLLPSGARILELASGSGEHGCYFCQKRSDIYWQPSDPNPESRKSILAWKSFYKLENMADPLDLDVRLIWPTEDFHCLVCINMIHISPWEASLALLAAASQRLVPGGYLYIYGPFLENDQPTAASNLGFDQSLRSRDPSWGIRRKEDLVEAAREYQLKLVQRVAMPANNLSLVFQTTVGQN